MNRRSDLLASCSRPTVTSTPSSFLVVPHSTCSVSLSARRPMSTSWRSRRRVPTRLPRSRRSASLRSQFRQRSRARRPPSLAIWVWTSTGSTPARRSSGVRSSRYDLICFKHFAAADSSGPRSVHYQDLLVLGPSAAEFDAAVDWVRTQDASPAFADVLDRVVHHARTDRTLR